MIRFQCPRCGKAFEVAKEKSVRVTVCPRCGGRCATSPGAVPQARDEEDEGATRQEAQALDEPGGLFSGMSPLLRRAVVLTACVAVGGVLLLLLPLPAGVTRALSSWCMVLVPCSVVILLVILHGQGTACPDCRKWWARTMIGTEILDREVFDQGGVPCAKSRYRTTFQCAACGHRWMLAQADESRQLTREWQKQHRSSS